MNEEKCTFSDWWEIACYESLFNKIVWKEKLKIRCVFCDSRHSWIKLKHPSVPKCNYSQDFSGAGESWVVRWNKCFSGYATVLWICPGKVGWEWGGGRGNHSRCCSCSLSLCVNWVAIRCLYRILCKVFCCLAVSSYAFGCGGWEAASKHVAIASCLLAFFCACCFNSAILTPTEEKF